ncbi:MAG: YybH family protein [Acidimicrobiales bacterium]
MSEPAQIIDDFANSLAARDVDRAVALYAPDAVVVRYEGAATGPDEIRSFLVGFLSGFDRFDLVSIDQVRESGDTLIWDASIETGDGVLQTTNVVLFNEDGLIVRHIPLLRGFWGKS